MELGRRISYRSGAGYSIEAILSGMILFFFAMNAIQVPEGNDWSNFQREVAAKDISYTLKKTGDVEQFLKNSDTGALRATASSLSDLDTSLSGTVENLPINEMSIGFHNTPDKIYWNQTEPVQSDDYCDGDLGLIDSTSEAQVRRTANGTDTLEDRYGVRLYFADTDPSIPGGFDGTANYDTIYVDNGTRCIFRDSEGPYYSEEIFYWGDRTDANPGRFFEFKRYDDQQESVNLFQADRAVRFNNILNKQINGIETDTTVETFNFSTPGLRDMDVIVFSGAGSLNDMEQNDQVFRDYMEDGSALLLMNLTQTDLSNPILQDIGFEWMDLPIDSSSTYTAAFSSFTESEKLETYYRGYGRDSSDISLSPGGKVISNQGDSYTSDDDLLFARNARYDTADLNATIASGEVWSEINPATPCSDTQATFDLDGTNIEVRNIDLAENSADCGEARALRIEQATGFSEPVLSHEIYEIDGRRYNPRIQSNESAELVFAGVDRVELVNYRRVLEDMEGNRVARAMNKPEFNQADREFLVSLIYWLKQDKVNFEGSTGETSLSTNIYGGINEQVYMPYQLKLRWGE